MLQRRIVVLALVGTAGLGVLAGGVAGVLDSGGGSGSHAAASSSAPDSASPLSAGAAQSDATPATPSATSSPSASPSTSAHPSSPLAKGRTYHLVVSGNLVMDVSGRDKKAGAAVILFSASASGAGGPNELWTVRDAGGGFVYLQSVNSGKCLAAGAGGRAVQNDCGNNAQEQWKPVVSGSGPAFVLTTRDGSKALGPSGNVGGSQGLGLVATGSGSQWQAVPA